MNKMIALLAVVFVASASAQVSVKKLDLGSGEPSRFANQGGVENARLVGSDNIYHVPQYLPGYPTAATIYPRVLKLPCTDEGAQKTCEGYQWHPDMGRGEYLFVEPVRANSPQVREVVKEVPGPERVILKEVPQKATRE